MVPTSEFEPSFVVRIVKCVCAPTDIQADVVAPLLGLINIDGKLVICTYGSVYAGPPI